MSVCANKDASPTLGDATLAMDGAGALRRPPTRPLSCRLMSLGIRLQYALPIECGSGRIQGGHHLRMPALLHASLRIALLAGRIAFRNKLVARGRGLLFVVVGYVVDRRAGRVVKFHAFGVEHVFLRPI